MPTSFRRPRFSHRTLRVVAAAALLTAAACESPEDRLVGRYVRTFREGVTPELGLDGQPERHVLILSADGKWRSEHPPMSLQQFDVPTTRGTWHLQGVTLMVAPTDLGPMQYTVTGDTLFPRTPPGARQAESMTGYSMKIGV